jgi:hypothetical protein
MNNSLWEWMIRTEARSYGVNQHFDGPSSFDVGPMWSFERFGQSRTALPDGRTILIAGEHEDGYDPDFYIYNDVVVQKPDGAIDIFGYPESDFPPTDFHSATLVDDRLILVGNLGYPDDRRLGETPVFALDIGSLRIEPIETIGDKPGWISSHAVEVADRSLIIRGGKVFDGNLVENIDDWSLDLDSRVWTRLTDRRWIRFELSRNDGVWIDLYEARLPDFCKLDLELKNAPEAAQVMGELQSKWLRVDPDLLESLYRPPIAHDVISGDEEDFKVFRVRIAGIVVRYVEELDNVTMTIEGELPESVVDLLAADLQRKLSEILQAPLECRRF